MSLHINYMSEPSEFGILSSLKKSPLRFLMEALGGCFAVGDCVRMCRSRTLAKAGRLLPSVFARRPLEEGAH